MWQDIFRLHVFHGKNLSNRSMANNPQNEPMEADVSPSLRLLKKQSDLAQGQW